MQFLFFFHTKNGNTIKRVIEERLTIDPIGFDKPLRYSLKLRIGDYRVVFRIEQKNKIIIIVAIKNHKNVYEH